MLTALFDEDEAADLEKLFEVIEQIKIDPSTDYIMSFMDRSKRFTRSIVLVLTRTLKNTLRQQAFLTIMIAAFFMMHSLVYI